MHTIMTKKITSILFSLFYLMNSISAQEVEALASPFADMDDMEQLEIIGKCDGRTIVYLTNYKKSKVLSYDSSLQKFSEYDLPINSKFHPFRPVIQKDSVLISYFRKENARAQLFTISLDPKLNPIDTVEIYSENYSFNWNLYEMKTNPGTKLCYLFKITNQSDLKVLSFEIDSKKMRDTFIISLQELQNQPLEFESIVDNNGTMHLVINKNSTSLKHKYSDWVVYSIRKDQSEKLNLRVENRLITSWTLALDEINNRLIIGGYYGMKSDEVSNGLFLIRINRQDFNWNSNFNTFSFEEVENMTGKKRKREKKRYIPQLKIQKLVPRSDGGMIYFGEFVLERVKQTEISMTGVDLRPYLEHYYENMLIHSINLNGEKDWYEVIYKKQHSQNDYAVYSSFLLLLEKKKLSILTNDEIKSKNTISRYEINIAGEMKRSHFILKKTRWPSIAFRLGKQFEYNKFIVPDFNRKKEFRILEISL